LKTRSLLLLLASIVGPLVGSPAAQEAADVSVAEILDRHDRALIRDLGAYLRKNPKAEDRDQAYASLFNKAIEHDWFKENEDLALGYLNSDPDGPVKALAQIIATMARAGAGQFDMALARHRDLMSGLGKADQEDFAVSFSDTFASAAMTAGEFETVRKIYQSLSERFSESTTVRDKVAKEVARLDRVGQPVPDAEAQDLDVREVVLVAQDLASYGRDQGQGERALVPLLERVAERVDRVRLLYLYPSDLDDRLAALMKRHGDAWSFNSNELVEEGGRLYRHGTFYTIEDYLHWAASHPDKSQ